MKFNLALLAASAALSFASSQGATLLAWDFAGATNTAASNTAMSTTTAVGVEQSTLTRGATISANNAANSFRGTGFSNDGIALTNTDYFEFTIAVPTGSTDTLSLASLYVNVNGTASFMNSPGVTMNFAYSVDDGANFVLLPTPIVRTSAGNSTFDVSGITALQGIDSATFRFYASGQTTTGGFGLQSAATAGTIGLAVEGTVPEPSTALLGALGALGLLRRRR